MSDQQSTSGGASAARQGDSTSSSTAPGALAPRRLRLCLAMAVLVVVVDIASKLIVVATLSDREPVRLLGGGLYVTQSRNAGAAWGLGSGTAAATVLFTGVAVVVAVVIVRAARRLHSIGWAIAFGLVLGGALGNLVDRIFRSPGIGRGHVVDWISPFAGDGSVFPIFNAADSAITCGAVLAILMALRGIEFDGRRTKDIEAHTAAENSSSEPAGQSGASA